MATSACIVLLTVIASKATAATPYMPAATYGQTLSYCANDNWCPENRISTTPVPTNSSQHIITSTQKGTSVYTILSNSSGTYSGTATTNFGSDNIDPALSVHIDGTSTIAHAGNWLFYYFMVSDPSGMLPNGVVATKATSVRLTASGFTSQRNVDGTGQAGGFFQINSLNQTLSASTGTVAFQRYTFGDNNYINPRIASVNSPSFGGNISNFHYSNVLNLDQSFTVETNTVYEIDLETDLVMYNEELLSSYTSTLDPHIYFTPDGSCYNCSLKLSDGITQSISSVPESQTFALTLVGLAVLGLTGFARKAS